MSDRSEQEMYEALLQAGLEEIRMPTTPGLSHVTLTSALLRAKIPESTAMSLFGYPDRDPYTYYLDQLGGRLFGRKLLGVAGDELALPTGEAFTGNLSDLIIALATHIVRTPASTIGQQLALLAASRPNPHTRVIAAADHAEAVTINALMASVAEAMHAFGLIYRDGWAPRVFAGALLRTAVSAVEETLSVEDFAHSIKLVVAAATEPNPLRSVTADPSGWLHDRG